jgi:glycosyltransferase involved in cell wall biosynthesis
MKIIHVLNHFLPYQTAGTEVYTLALCKELLALDEEVQVIIPNYGADVSDAYTYEGVKVHRYAEPSVVNRSLIMGKRKPDGLQAFVNLLAQNKPDIIHFHELAGSNGITLHHVKAANATGAKVVFTFHLAGYSCKTGTLVYKGKKLCNGKMNTVKCSSCYLAYKGYAALAPILTPVSFITDALGIDASRLQNKFGTALGTATLIRRSKEQLYELAAACDMLVVLTQWYKNVLLLNGISENKITYIPQALPFRTFINTKNNVPKNESPLRLIFIGRISAFKGLHLLLQVIRDFEEQKISLDVYGATNDAVYEKQCKAMSAGKKNVSWKGLLPTDQVVATMRQYHALCLCSTFSEMSPLVIQEAFAAGIPVIASHVYGNAEQIRHGYNGLLFRFNDVKSLRAQIQACIDDPTLLHRLAANIQPPADFNRVAAAYHQLYQKLKSEL